MGFKAGGGNNNTSAIYAKLNAADGKIVVACEHDTPGAVEYTVKKGVNEGQKRYRLEERGIVGKLVAITTREDNYMGQAATDVTLAFADENPAEPTILLTARLVGGEKGAVSQSVLGALEALVKADKSKVLDFGLAHNPAGSKFTDKEGKEQTRDTAQTTVFVRHKGDEAKNFIHDSRDARPAIEDIRDKAGKLVTKDYTDLRAYAVGVVGTLIKQVEENRAALKALMAEAGDKPPQAGDDPQFGG